MAEKQRGPPNISSNFASSDKEKDVVGKQFLPKKAKTSTTSMIKEQKFKSGEEQKHFSFKISKPHHPTFSHHHSTVRHAAPTVHPKDLGPQKTISHFPTATRISPVDSHILQKHGDSEMSSKIKITAPRSLKEQQDRLLETLDNQASLKQRSEEAYKFQSSPKQIDDGELQDKVRDSLKKKQAVISMLPTSLSTTGSASFPPPPHHQPQQQQQQQQQQPSTLPVSQASLSKIKYKEIPEVVEKYPFAHDKSLKRYHLIERGELSQSSGPAETSTHVSRSKLTEALLQDNVISTQHITHSASHSFQKKSSVSASDLKAPQISGNLPVSDVGSMILTSQLFNIGKDSKETTGTNLVTNPQLPGSVKSSTSKPEIKTVPGSLETRLMSPLKIETSLGSLPQFFSPGRMLEEMAARHAASPSQSATSLTSPQKVIGKVPFLGQSPLRLPSPSSDRTKSPSHARMTPVSSALHLLPPLSLSSPSLSPGGSSLSDRHASPLIAGIPGFLPFPGLNLPLPHLYSPSLTSPAISSPLSSESIGGSKDSGMQLYRGLSESFSPQITEKAPPPAHSDQISGIKHISSPIPPTAHLRVSPVPVQQVVSTELPTDLSVKQQKVASIVTEIIKSARQSACTTAAQDTKPQPIPFSGNQDVKAETKQPIVNLTYTPFNIPTSQIKQSTTLNSSVPLNISLLQTKPGIISASSGPPNISFMQTKPSTIATLNAPPNVSLLQTVKDVKQPLISLSRIPAETPKTEADNFQTGEPSVNITKTDTDINFQTKKVPPEFPKTEVVNFQTVAPKLSLPNLFFSSKASNAQLTENLKAQQGFVVNPFTFPPQSIKSSLSNVQMQQLYKTAAQDTSTVDTKYSPNARRSVEKSPANRLGSDAEDMPTLEPQVSLQGKQNNLDALAQYSQLPQNTDELEEIQPFNMRLHNLNNFPSNTNNLYRSTYRSQSMAIHRLKVHSGCVTSAAKSLDLLRQNLQKSINKEISEIMQRYIDTYFKLGVENIQYNHGSSAAGEEHVQAVCRQILEEAKKMYIQERRSVTPVRDIPDNTSENGSTGSRNTFVKRKRRLSDSDSVDSAIIIKKKKGRPISNSGRSTPSKMKPEPVKREGPKWDPERLRGDSLFVMGSRANKALGLGATRGRIYMKHPELFKYSGDQDDKQWLYEHHYMPATGGKTYLMILEDIKELSETEEYRSCPGLILKELVGFCVPEWMVEKMRSQMISHRTDVPKTKHRSRSTTPSDMTIIKLDQYDSDPLEQPKELPFSSFRSPTPHDDVKDFSVSPSGTEEMFLSTVENESNPCELSPFNMTGGFAQNTSPVASDLDTMDDDPRLALT